MIVPVPVEPPQEEIGACGADTGTGHALSRAARNPA